MMGTTKIPKKERVYKVKVKFDKKIKGKDTFNFETHMPQLFKKGKRVTMGGRVGTVVSKKKTRKMSRL